MEYSSQNKPGTIKVVSLVLFVLYSLILIGSMNALESSLSNVGLLALGFVFVFTNIGIFFMLLNGGKIYKTQFFIIILLSILTVICIYPMLRDRDFGDVMNILQLIMCVGFLIYISFLNLDYSKIKILNLVTVVFILVHFCLWIVSGFPRMFSSFYPNPNLVGPYMFYTSFFLIIGAKFSRIKIVYYFLLLVSFVLMLASDSRSILISVLAAIVVFILWNFITISKFVRIIFFGLLITAFLSFIFIYPHLPEYRFYIPLENWMLTHTGKSIMSGRNDIWIPLTAMVEQQPYFGYGMNTVATDLIGHDKSAHNLYLNTLMQIGYVGFSVLIIILFTIWMRLTSVKDDFFVRLSGAYMIAILVHQNFEITLFQNQLSIGMLQWLIIAIGLSRIFNNKKEGI